MDESIKNILCCDCNSEKGYITMNCEFHKEKKMLCASCWTKKGAPLMCIEQGCQKQVHVKYETVQLKTWKEHIQIIRTFFHSKTEIVIAFFTVFWIFFSLYMPTWLKDEYTVKLPDHMLLASIVVHEHWLYFGLFALFVIFFLCCALYIGKTNQTLTIEYIPLFSKICLKNDFFRSLSTNEIASIELLLCCLFLWFVSLFGWIYIYMDWMSPLHAAYLDIFGTWTFFCFCCYLWRNTILFMLHTVKDASKELIDTFLYTRNTIIL